MKSASIILFLALFISLVGSCQTNIEHKACPDTSFSQKNLDALEVNNPNFIWRICNTNKNIDINNIRVYEYLASTPEDSLNLDFSILEPCECSSYLSDSVPIQQIDFKQNGKNVSKIYLANRLADRGMLNDTLKILDSPGRYIYSLKAGSTDTEKIEVIIEREAYY